MKWLLSFLCFSTITVFSQTNKESLLERLKKTQEKLGRTAPGLNYERLQLLSSINSKNSGRIASGSTSNAKAELNYKRLKPSIMNPDQQTAIIALKQDNMPCVMPNMEFWKAMPNARGKVLLENPIDPGIYLQKPKS